ncbi:MAG: hypothetical protein E6G92_00085 [Alphaproteobacteria bacterium]|nr:MAG: hypothetical protein E6G92_00085 [Alphaproteobacteria bacterium]
MGPGEAILTGALRRRAAPRGSAPCRRRSGRRARHRAGRPRRRSGPWSDRCARSRPNRRCAGGRT